jgi:hypothetical protein
MAKMYCRLERSIGLPRIRWFYAAPQKGEVDQTSCRTGATSLKVSQFGQLTGFRAESKFWAASNKLQTHRNPRIFIGCFAFNTSNRAECALVRLLENGNIRLDFCASASNRLGLIVSIQTTMVENTDSREITLWQPIILKHRKCSLSTPKMGNAGYEVLAF